MSLSYNKTWEVMNGLEESFNRIITLDFMIEELSEAINDDDRHATVDLIKAIKSYMPIYIRQYEKSSQKAWDNTVKKLFDKNDNPYRTDSTDTDFNYSEVEKFFESEMDNDLGLYVSNYLGKDTTTDHD
jgi:hypothetical protein